MVQFHSPGNKYQCTWPWADILGVKRGMGIAIDDWTSALMLLSWSVSNKFLSRHRQSNVGHGHDILTPMVLGDTAYYCSYCRCSTLKPTSGSVHSLPSAGFGSCAVPPGPNITLLPHPPVAPPPVGGPPPEKLMGGGGGGWNAPVPHYVRYHHQEQCPHYNNR